MTDLNTPDAKIAELRRDKAGGYHVQEKVVAGTGRSVTKEEGYSVQELVALKKIMAGGSDDARTQQVIDLAITKTVVKQTEQLAKTIANLMNGKQTNINVGGETIVRATKQSAAHARRPGG